MSIGIILLIILLVLVIGGLPQWPYSSAWSYGYYPSGIVGVILVIVLVLVLLGRL